MKKKIKIKWSYIIGEQKEKYQVVGEIMPKNKIWL